MNLSSKFLSNFQIDDLNILKTEAHTLIERYQNYMLSVNTLVDDSVQNKQNYESSSICMSNRVLSAITSQIYYE